VVYRYTVEFIPIDLDDLKKDYLNGESLRSLARKHNTSKLTIKRKLNKAGVDVLSSSEYIAKYNIQHANKSSNRYEYNDDNIIKLYHDGMSINQIINEFGVSEPSVRKLINNKRTIDKQYISNRFCSIYEKVKPEFINHSHLHDLYHNKKWSITDISNFYSYDEEVVRRAFIKYGIDRRNMAEASLVNWEKNNYRSSLERIVKVILDDNSIKNEKFVHGGYEFDFLIDDRLLVEVNGLFYHLNCDKKVIRDKDKYDYWLNNLKNKYDFKLLWEHFAKSNGSLYDLLNSWLCFRVITVDKSKITFSRISYGEADLFCRSYHYHRKTRKGDYYGAFYNNKLIAVAVFSSVTRKQSADRLGISSNRIRELSRFCINGSYRSENLASFILSRFEKLFSINNSDICCLLTFADQTEGHVGTIYRATNWKIDGMSRESYFYEKDGMRWHKKTIWQNAKCLGMKECEFSNMFGLNQIKTLKKYRFIKYINK